MNKWDILEYVLKDEQDKVPKKFWSDEEFVFHAVHWNGFNFQYASNNLKKSEKFVAKIVKYWSYTFQYADLNLRKKEEK